MNDSIRQNLDGAGSLSLTPEERAATRMALEVHMSLSLTEQEKTDVRRILQEAVFSDAPFSGWSWLRLPIRLPSLAVASFLLIAASGGGMVYAAEDALPGDILYPVKIHVNEAVRAKLRHTPEERARFAIVRLERRMDELKKLEARGYVDVEAEAVIATQLEAVVHELEVEVEGLPADAAQRAALRTAARAALGTDTDDVRRASKVARVLKALRERADGDGGRGVMPALIPPLPVTITGEASSMSHRSRASTPNRSRASEQAVSSAPVSEAEASLPDLLDLL